MLMIEVMLMEGSGDTVRGGILNEGVEIRGAGEDVKGNTGSKGSLLNGRAVSRITGRVMIGLACKGREGAAMRSIIEKKFSIAT